MGTQPKIICDTGHNKEALTYIFSQIATESFDNLHIVFGVVNDKDIASILPIMPKSATYYFCRPNVPRGLEAEILQSQFRAHGFIGKAYKSVNHALQAAKIEAKNTDLIFVGGSTFVVAEVI
ncbi:MAG: hypothetical protein AAF889_03330 [Cyanobacteria bacterium P01_D01_bin.73]